MDEDAEEMESQDATDNVLLIDPHPSKVKTDAVSTLLNLQVLSS
jgi:hypothetical protein